MNHLSSEERRLLRSYERGEWKSIKNAKTEMKRYQIYARYTLRKRSRVNIRISPSDLAGIQRKAFEEGIPYQTLIASVIHKYVAGRLLEKR